MTRLLLLRHAESEWNAQGRWQGLADPPLSPRGEAQAAQAGPLLRPMAITAVVSSDLHRARATAGHIALGLPVAGPIDHDGGLREYDVGAWSGLTRPQIEAGWPGAVEAWREGRLFSTPGGEQRDAFVARISAAVARVARKRPDDITLVITHGGVISALCRSLDAPAHRFAHLSGLWIEATAEGLRPGEVVSLLRPDRRKADGGEGDGGELARSGVMDTPGR
ncbi:MAG: 2,3-bisphosphoglycerate-dependent phosphoglycerate mutase [Acidimicrobiaceae bacterium]|jgi:probable phosphoglycerate mutase|nr:2,3-bisphosphoglycerate-dependent phosphoglycerate mutase [Acidimicrobiaceae bacterium]